MADRGNVEKTKAQPIYTQQRKDGDGHVYKVSTGVLLSTGNKTVLGIFIAIFFSISYVVLDADKYPVLMHVVSGEKIVNMNPVTEALDFGGLLRGTSAVRQAILENRAPVPMFVIIFKTGEIANLIDVEKNFFTLAAHNDTRVGFTVYVPASAELMHSYHGRIYFFKIPAFAR